VVVHLSYGSHIDSRLPHVKGEARDAVALGTGMVRSSEKKAERGMRCSGAPTLLAVDDPDIVNKVGTCREGGQVRASVRLAEQLAPDVLPGQQWTKELLSLGVIAVLEQRWTHQVNPVPWGHADGAGSAKLVGDDPIESDWKSSSVPAYGPGGTSPARVS
jgi:hypothetical protein